MKIFDLFAMSMSALFKRKTRTFLTISGVILGAASVTLTFAIGQAVKQNSAALLSDSRTLRVISITNDSYMSGNSDNKSKTYLDDDLINKLKKRDDIEAMFYFMNVGSFTNWNTDICSGKKDKYWCDAIYGINFEDFQKLGCKLIGNKSLPSNNYKFKPTDKTIRVIAGQYIDYEFCTHKNNQFISRYEYSPAMQYFMSKWNPIYEPPKKQLPPLVNIAKDSANIRIRYPKKFNSDTISEYDLNYDPDQISTSNDNDDENSFFSFQKYKTDIYGFYDWENIKDDVLLANLIFSGLYIDIDSAKSLIKETRKLNNIKIPTPEFEYSQIMMFAKDINYVNDITKELTKQGYNVFNLSEEIKNEQARTQSNQFILGSLGFLSLIVSAISIVNTMVTSVYERTKEIGIMKVLGCKIGNIQLMFLLESMAIGLFGGCIGVGVSYWLSNFMNKLIANQDEATGVITKIISQYMQGMKSGLANALSSGQSLKVAIVNPKLIILVILGTTLLGLLAGYFPAVTASRISALQAMKSND